MDTETALRIKELMDNGLSSHLIALETGLTKQTVNRYISKIRSGNLPETKRKQQIEALVEAGTPTVEMARATGLTSRGAKIWEDKIKGEHSPIDDELRREVAKGTRLSTLTSKFGLTKDNYEQAIFGLFDSTVLVSSHKLGDDIAIYTVKDSGHQFSWVNSRKENAVQSYVCTDNNYMYTRFLNEESLPDTIRVFNFTDTHIGSKHCRTDLLKQHIKMVAEDPGAFAFLGGDIFEHMTKLSVGQPHEQVLSPMDQIAVSARMFMPIAHKIIRYVGGNHDRGRAYKHVGIDPAEVLANILKVPYSAMETTIDLNFGGNLFTAILHHGAGSGGSHQQILMDAEKYRKSCDYFVNWHLSGHVHNAFTISRMAKRKIVGKGFFHQRYYTVIGGSYMKYTGTYAEEAKYDPTPQDLSYIEMSKDGSYDAGCVKIDSI